MIIPTILIAVTFASSGISSYVIPNLQQTGSDFIYHQLEPKVSASDEEVTSYLNQEYQPAAEGVTEEVTGHPLYQNDQKLDRISKHSNYRGDESKMKIDTGDMEDVKYDDTANEVQNDQEANTNPQTDDSSKVAVQEREEEEESYDKQEKANNLTDEESESEEINADSQRSKETDDKNSDHEDFEDHDKFKWPNENDWYEKFGYKDYDNGNKFHRKFGRYGMYGTFDKFGEYTGYGGSYGCLELGHGEYC